MIARFTLSIKCSGFAFDDETGAVTHESAAPELARILRDVAYRIEIRRLVRHIPQLPRH
jgi:hypothetical protein